MPPRKKKAPPDSELVDTPEEPAKPSKLVFNGTTLNKLINAILQCKPYQAPHREIGKMWQATVDEFNANTNDQKRLTIKTAREKFKQLLDMHLNGKPSSDLKAVFKDGEDALFASLLDILVKDVEDVENTKAEKSGKMARLVDEKKAAGARARARGMEGLVLTNAAKEQKGLAGAEDNIAATESRSASASTIPSSPSSAPLQSQLQSHSRSRSHPITAIAPTGPARDALSQFMSVQNRVAEQRAQINRALMSEGVNAMKELVNESKKQTRLFEVGLDLIKSHSSSVTIPPASPQCSALHRSPLPSPSAPLSPLQETQEDFPLSSERKAAQPSKKRSQDNPNEAEPSKRQCSSCLQEKENVDI